MVPVVNSKKQVPSRALTAPMTCTLLSSWGCTWGLLSTARTPWSWASAHTRSLVVWLVTIQMAVSSIHHTDSSSFLWFSHFLYSQSAMKRRSAFCASVSRHLNSTTRLHRLGSTWCMRSSKYSGVTAYCSMTEPSSWL